MADDPAPTPIPEKKTLSRMAPREPPAGKLVLDAREVAWLTGRSYFDVRRWAVARELPVIAFPSVEQERYPKGRKRTRKHTRRDDEPIRRLLFSRADVEHFIERCKRRSA